jgi:hypothetical protein
MPLNNRSKARQVVYLTIGLAALMTLLRYLADRHF